MVRSSSLLLVSFFFASSAHAAPLVDGLGGPRGYGSDCLPRNDDDGSSRAIDLRSAFGSGLRFFSETYEDAYVNTNGSLSFAAPLQMYMPQAFPVGAAVPMIAPFWADIDTRRRVGGLRTCEASEPGVCEGEGGNAVWWHVEPGRMVVTWDEVGHYRCTTDRTVSAQLIITPLRDCRGGRGDFDVEFRYENCGWESGDASGGTDGFGGTTAQAGFDAGNREDFVSIEGSREAGIGRRLCQESNVGTPGVWRFAVRAGEIQCPDAGQPCETGMSGICAEGVLSCTTGGTVCVPRIRAVEEGCDSLDNDCDGAVDEGDDICPATAFCDRGACVDVCFEGGCPEGQVCREDGRCVVNDCEDRSCPEGERCADGRCIAACEDVVCPVGQLCRSGRCVRPCARLRCDPECSACSLDDTCVPRCDLPGGDCAADETCTASGQCVPSDCFGVPCPEGLVCSEGACVDPCAGAVCPAGDRCERGRCVSPGQRDSTTPPSGAPPDAGQTGRDAGAGTPARSAGSGCGCRTLPRSSAGGGLFLIALGVIAYRRRR